MLLANKKAIMTLLYIVNSVAFNPLITIDPIAVRCSKLSTKLDEQIQLSENIEFFDYA